MYHPGSRVQNFQGHLNNAERGIASLHGRYDCQPHRRDAHARGQESNRRLTEIVRLLEGDHLAVGAERQTESERHGEYQQESPSSTGSLYSLALTARRMNGAHGGAPSVPGGAASVSSCRGARPARTASRRRS